MDYSSERLRALPFPPRTPHADGTHSQEWDLELDAAVPPNAEVAGGEVLAAAADELRAVLREQGFAALAPSEEELRRLDVRLMVLGGSRIRVQLRLIDGRANLALGITARVWRAIERRFSRIRCIQGVEREAWRLFLGPLQEERGPPL